jgi:hypothetical protein
MAGKIVDVFLQDVLVESYELPASLVHAPLFEQDFIDRAKVRMKADNYSDRQIAEARFIVRD